MLPFAVVAGSALMVSALTLYSGFGLGTLLMPVFALFFPVEVAVAATAVVHGANNVFKLGLVGRHADREIVQRFGIPAIAAAFAGAAALGYVSNFGEVARYALGSRTAVITPLKLVMASLMLVFVFVEFSPKLKNLRFERRHLFLGGLLSGFFGGFSGHQGAFRSVFLTKAGISSEAFVGTNAVVGFMVDATRLTAYAAIFLSAGKGVTIGAKEWPLVITGIVSAFAGVMAGKRFLHKITMKTIQSITGLLLFCIAVALGFGII